MKSIYFIIALCALSSFQSFGQTFDWLTNDTIEANLELNTTVLLKMEQSAIGNDTVTLGIEIIYNDLPAAWDGMVCIEGTCLGIIPPVGTTGTMTPISGAQTGYVRLTVNPMNGTEVAKLQIYVYDLNFPNDGDTATWLLNKTLSIEEGDAWGDLTLYPNPTSESLVIQTENELEHAEVYTLSGELVTKITDVSSGVLDLTNLGTGMYFIKLVQPNGLFAVRKVQKL